VERRGKKGKLETSACLAEKVIKQETQVTPGSCRSGFSTHPEQWAAQMLCEWEKKKEKLSNAQTKRAVLVWWPEMPQDRSLRMRRKKKKFVRNQRSLSEPHDDDLN
jgi:hypothetical protein